MIYNNMQTKEEARLEMKTTSNTAALSAETKNQKKQKNKKNKQTKTKQKL